MSKILMISPKKCKNCGTCEAVCPNSAVDVIYFKEVKMAIPVMCMQCEDAACLTVCPTGALSRNEENVVISNPDKCIGCKMCLNACPMGNISYSSRKKQIMKCNLCDGSPNCVKYCPTRALEFVDGTEANMDKKRVIASKFKELFEVE